MQTLANRSKCCMTRIPLNMYDLNAQGSKLVTKHNNANMQQISGSIRPPRLLLTTAQCNFHVSCNTTPKATHTCCPPHMLTNIQPSFLHTASQYDRHPLQLDLQSIYRLFLSDPIEITAQTWSNQITVHKTCMSQPYQLDVPVPHTNSTLHYWQP